MKTNLRIKSANNQTIDQEIDSILRFLSEHAHDGERVIKTTTKRGLSCKRIIEVKRGESVTTRYVFYPNMYIPNRIGSVAIYCGDAKSLFFNIRGQSSLFGHTIMDVTLESGVRPYLDVKFKVSIKDPSPCGMGS